MNFLKQNLLKIGIVLVFLSGSLLFFLFDLSHYLTLESLRHSKAELALYHSAHPFLTMSVYLLIYIIMTALSLPGAAILTIAAGTLFGLIKGTLLVSFASTLGATLAMLIARTLLKQYVQQKFKNHLPTIHKKFEEDGAFYLFTLRLIPIFPFFVVNVVMGLTTIRVFTFAWVSQIGMLAGTLVYVNAGVELGKIDSLGDIASPGLWISFAFLGILPLALKKTVAWISQKRKVPPP